jgi:hypothetical protein
VIITDANYYSKEADNDFMSVHQYLNWHRCPDKEKARQEGRYIPPESGDAKKVGSYIDIALLEPQKLDAFVFENHGEIFKSQTQKARNEGIPPEKYAAFAQADLCIERVKNSPMAMELIRRGQTQEILTGEIDGRPWKGRLDLVIPEGDIFLDLKSAADFEDGWKEIKNLQGETRNVKVPWYVVWDYMFQLAMYQELLRQKYGRLFIPMLLGVTKQKPPDLGAWTFRRQEKLDAYRGLMLADHLQIWAYKTGAAKAPACGKNSCDWCRGQRTLDFKEADWT